MQLSGCVTSNRSLSASTAHQNYFCLCLLVGMDGDVWNKQPEGMSKQVLPTSPLEERWLKPSKPWRSHAGRWENTELAEGLGRSSFPGDSLKSRTGCDGCLTSASCAVPTRSMSPSERGGQGEETSPGGVSTMGDKHLLQGKPNERNESEASH